MGKSMLHAERAKEKEGRCERRPKSQPRREEGDGRWGAERARRDIGSCGEERERRGVTERRTEKERRRGPEPVKCANARVRAGGSEVVR